ncbi:efflux RND transporter periplasmic adaptor subunit [Myroides sp. LJL110]
MKKFFRSIRFLFLAGLLVGSGFLVSCENKQDQSQVQMPLLEVKVDVVESKDANILNTYTASLKGKVNVEIRPKVSGYIESILTEEGSYVKKGQIILQIDPKPYQIQLNNAQASLKAAQAGLVNAELEKNKVVSLLENSFVSPIQLQSAEANLQTAQAVVAQAQAQVAQANLNLGYCQIKAPVDGFLGLISQRVGNLVSPTDPEPLTTLSDINQIYAYFSLSESNYLDLVKENKNQQNVLNMPAKLILSNGQPYDLPGKVDVINGEFNQQTNAITVRANFPNPEKLLRNGGTGTIQLISIEKDITQIPIAATVDLQDKIFAYVLGADNIVEQRQLKIKGKDLHTYFIESGVEPGETLIITGVDKLRDQMQVSPLSDQKQ